jgi:hypothetical protein
MGRGSDDEWSLNRIEPSRLASVAAHPPYNIVPTSAPSVLCPLAANQVHSDSHLFMSRLEGPNGLLSQQSSVRHRHPQSVEDDETARMLETVQRRQMGRSWVDAVMSAKERPHALTAGVCPWMCSTVPRGVTQNSPSSTPESPGDCGSSFCSELESLDDLSGSASKAGSGRGMPQKSPGSIMPDLVRSGLNTPALMSDKTFSMALRGAANSSRP